MSPSTSTHSVKHSIYGSVPGLLDPSQADRLLRLPGSKLSFAAFDPRTAFAEKDVPDLRKLSLKDELSRPKRVVVESTASGQSFWRFVPKARREEGVQDEGTWPRPIEICGEMVECSQDQWDIYKLDPAYDCFVQAYPKITTISRILVNDNPAQPEPEPEPPQPTLPRRPASTLFTRKLPLLSTRKPHTKKPTVEDVGDSDKDANSDDDDDEFEVENMVIDGSRPQPRPSGVISERLKQFREKKEQSRKLRRARILRAEVKRRGRPLKEDYSMLDLTKKSPSTQVADVSPEITLKRKMTPPSETLRRTEEDTSAIPPATKRNRTVSPGTVKREIARKKLERDKRKELKMQERLDGWRRQKQQEFMENILAGVPEAGPALNGVKESDEHADIDSESDSTDDDDEAAREAAIIESRRKLAELEADRPLWEEEARKRLLREQEEAARQAQARQRKQAEAKQAAEARKEEEAKAQAAAQRLQNEMLAKQDRENRRRQQRERWSTGPWTLHRALERYRSLSEAFDSAKFSLEDPLFFDAVPWPVLHSPISFTVEDVEWSAVENFFAAVKPHMRLQDYKVFVEKSHRRFHPDRWRSRGILKSITDDAERGCLEVAANTVAQALTPIWRELRGR